MTTILIYVEFRSKWVLRNLTKVCTDGTKYLINDASKKTVDEHIKNIHNFFNQESLNYDYWMWKKFFCFNIKKIIGEENYNKLYHV